MASIDLKRLEKFNKYVSDPAEVVAQCEMWIHHPLEEDDPLRFKIKVLKYSDGKFMGVPSHRVGNYVSLHQQDTIQMAVEDALSGISAYYTPERPIHEQLSPYEDYC